MKENRFLFVFYLNKIQSKFVEFSESGPDWWGFPLRRMIDCPRSQKLQCETDHSCTVPGRLVLTFVKRGFGSEM